MGNEELIYGVRNGESYREYEAGHPISHEIEDGKYRDEQPFVIKNFWANSIKVHSFDGGGGVNITARRHDQETGVPAEDEQITIELDRSGINRMIKALRTHRDKHFGKDE